MDGSCCVATVACVELTLTPFKLSSQRHTIRPDYYTKSCQLRSFAQRNHHETTRSGVSRVAD